MAQRIMTTITRTRRTAAMTAMAMMYGEVGAGPVTKTKKFLFVIYSLFTTFHLTNVNWLTKERDG